VLDVNFTARPPPRSVPEADFEMSCTFVACVLPDAHRAAMTTTTASETRPAGRRRVAAESRVPRARVTLVTVGAQPVRLFKEQPRTADLPALANDDDVERLIALASRAAARGGYVVVVHPVSLPQATLRRLAMVRSMLASRRLALCPVSLPPLGVSVVTATVASVLDRVRYPGAIVAAAEQLPDRLAAFTCLATVARLGNPAPGIGDRLASMFPGSEFVVTHRPVPHLTRVTRRRPSVPMPAMRQPLGLVTTAADADGWVARFLLPALGQPTMTVVEPAGPATGRRDSADVEAVVYPLRLPETATRLLQNLDDRACSWCGELAATERCPFCHMHGPAAVA
jgi:hypothetical protein